MSTNPTHLGSNPNSTYSSSLDSNKLNDPTYSGSSNLNTGSTYSGSNLSSNSGLTSNQTGLLSNNPSTFPSNQSGLSSDQSGLNTTTGSNLGYTSSSHPSTLTGGAATGAAAASGLTGTSHGTHTHPHHHEHLGHHSTTGTTGLNTTNYPQSTTTRDVAAGAAAGGLASAAASHAAHTHPHHHQHVGHHPADTVQRPGVVGNDPDVNRLPADTVLPGTGVASGFAVTDRTAAPINPATGAPDYMAVQTATIQDNVPRTLGGTAATAAVGAASNKNLTARGLPKRVLMVLSSSSMTMPDGKNTGYHWSEVFHPWEVFKKHGYDVDLTSITGKATPDYHSVNFTDQLTQLEISAMSAWRSKNHELHKLLDNILAPNALNSNNYGIIYFTGGHGTLEDFPNAERYQQIAADIYDRNGVVCAVCHGVVALGNVRLSNGNYLLNGKQVTGFSEEGEKRMKVLDWMHERKFPLVADHVSRAGGIYQSPDKPLGEFVVDSDRVITGANPASSGPVAERAVRILEGR